MKFLPTVIFFLYLKKNKNRHHQSWTFFFKMDFYYLFVYSMAVVFFIQQVSCFCLMLVLAIRVLTLKTSAIGSAKHLCNQQAYCYPSTRPLCPEWERSMRGGKAGERCWQAYTGHKWQGTARYWKYLSWSHW